MADSAVVGLLRVLLTASTAEFETAMKRTSDSAKAWTKDLKAIGQQASDLGVALTKTLTVPILGLGAGAIKVAADFESAFANVRKTMEATPEGFKKVEDGIRSMAQQIPMAAEDLANIAALGGQFGISADNILAFTRTVADLGVAVDGISPEDAAAGLAQFAKVTGTAEGDVFRLAASLVDLGNKGNSTEAMILEFSKRLAGAGAQIGLTAPQIMGIGAAMANLGINAEAGGTAMSKVMSKMEAAVERGGGQLEGFARIAGMSAEQFAESFKTKPVEALEAFIEGLGRSKDSGESLTLVLDEMDMRDARLTDSLKRLAGAHGELKKQVDFSTAAAAQGTAHTEEAEKKYGTFNNQLKVLWNQVKDVAITFGNALLPMFRDLISVAQPVVQFAASLAQMFSELPAPVRMTGVAVLGLLAAVGPVTFAFGQLTSSAATLTKVFTTQGIVTRALTIAFPEMGAAAGIAAIGVRALQAALAGIGIGLVITAIGFLIEKLRAVGQEVEDVTGRPVKQLLDANGRVVMTLDEAKQKAAELGGELISGLGQPLILAANAMSQQAAPAAKTLKDGLASIKAELAGLNGEQRAQLAAGAQYITSTKDLTESFNRLYPSVKLSEAAVDLFKDRLQDAQKHTKAFWEESDKLGKQNLTLADVLGKLDTVAGSYSDVLMATQREVSKLTTAQKANIDAGKRMGESEAEIAAHVGVSEQAVKLYVDQLEKNQAATKKMWEENDRLNAKTIDVDKTFADFTTHAGTLTQELEATKREIGNLTAEQQANILAGQKMGLSVKDIAAALKISEQAVKGFIEQSKGMGTWKDSIANLSQAFSQLAQVAGDSFKGVAQAVGTVVSSLDIGVKAGETFHKGFISAIAGGGKELAKGIAGMATGLVSGIAGIMGATSTSSALQNAIGGAVSGAALGASVGATIGASMASTAAQGAAYGGAWGLAAGAIVGIFIGIFRGRDTRREMERVGEEWGVSISQGVADKIKDTAKDLFHGNRQAARLFNLSDILGEAGGLDGGNLGEFTARLRDVFVMLETGAFTSAQAMHVLEENWSQFAKVGTDASGRLSGGLREILFLAQQNGVMTASMTQYTRDQAQVAITGFAGIVSGSQTARDGYAQLAQAVLDAQKKVEDLKATGVTGGVEMRQAQASVTQALDAQAAAAAGATQELSDMGLVAVGVYAAAIANGMTHAEAIAAAGPAIAQITKAYRDLGLDIDNAAFRSLALQAQIQQNNPNLIEGVNSLSKSFIALSNTNSLNADSFRAMERLGAQMYGRLQAETQRTAEAMGDFGDHTSDALLPMQDYLREAEKQAKLLGIPLDENTQRMIDQSKELGIWKETGPTATEAVTGAVNELVKAVKELIHQMQTVPPRIDTTFTTHYQETGQPPANYPDGAVFTPPESFARGSDGIRDFGTGRLAMLHGREGVYTEAQIAALQSGVGGLSISVDARESNFDTPGSLDRLVQKIERAFDQKLSLGRRSPAFSGVR